jgi:SHS2 domain-containing protein
MEGAELVPGVHALEHTADLAIAIDAGSLAELFDRAAVGLRVLLDGSADGGDAVRAPRRSGSEATLERRTIVLEADDVPQLLVHWLRELLYLHQVDGLAYHSAEFDTLGKRGLVAHVAGATGASVTRELKGVTYHDLRAEPRNGRWYGRVIFDV